MSLITVGLALAKLVPDVLNLFNKADDDGKENMASMLIDTARKVLPADKAGADLEKLATTLLVTPAAKQDFIVNVTQELPNYEAYVKEVAAAREFGLKAPAVLVAQLDKITESVMKWNMAYALGLVLIQIVFTWLLVDQPVLIALIGNIIGLVVGQLLAERLQILNYFYGSSAVPSTNKKDN